MKENTRRGTLLDLRHGDSFDGQQESPIGGLYTSAHLHGAVARPPLFQEDLPDLSLTDKG